MDTPVPGAGTGTDCDRLHGYLDDRLITWLLQGDVAIQYQVRHRQRAL